MSVYERDYRIKSSDADAKQRLRISRMFTILQEVSIEHTTELKMGRDMTLDRGLLWIVTLQQASITRMPEYDELVHIATWPGNTMHILFPRYYRITDAAGNALIEASALWALMDRNTRKVIFPEEHGVAIKGMRTGKEIPLPRAPKIPKTEESEAFTVPYSYVDLNGHMGNTRYFDLAEDRMPPALRARNLIGIQTEYSREALLNTEVLLKSEVSGDAFLLSGEYEGQKLFRLSLTYAPEA